MQRLGLDFYEREQSGRIMTRMTTDVDALSTFLQTGLITMVSAVLTFFGVLAALLIINLKLGLAVLGIFPPLIVATIVFRNKSSRAYAESREKVAAVNADLAENVAGLRVTQAFRRSRPTGPGSPTSAARSWDPGCVPSGTSRCTSRSSRPCPRSRARSSLSSRPGTFGTGR